MPSKQETFDAVARHLLTQGRAAVAGPIPEGDDSVGACQYLARNGDKCAVGCLIPDGDYHARFEGSAIEQDGSTGISVLMDRLGHNLELLEQLQDLHDRLDPAAWAASLRRMAYDHGLSATVLDEFPG